MELFWNYFPFIGPVRNLFNMSSAPTYNHCDITADIEDKLQRVTRGFWEAQNRLITERTKLSNGHDKAPITVHTIYNTPNETLSPQKIENKIEENNQKYRELFQTKYLPEKKRRIEILLPRALSFLVGDVLTLIATIMLVALSTFNLLVILLSFIVIPTFFSFISNTVSVHSCLKVQREIILQENLS